MLTAAGNGLHDLRGARRRDEHRLLWISIGVAVLTGGLIALLHALCRSRFRVDQIISGVVINLLALGVTGFIRSEVIVPTGISIGVQHLRHRAAAAVEASRSSASSSSRTSRSSSRCSSSSPLTSFVLFRTPFGLRVRSVGENPHAAETLGIDVIRIRYTAVIIGGLIAGLAGAWFSLESQAGFEDNMTNGTGFIALAALIFGKWRPWTAFAGAMLFGFTRPCGARCRSSG